MILVKNIQCIVPLSSQGFSNQLQCLCNTTFLYYSKVFMYAYWAIVTIILKLQDIDNPETIMKWMIHVYCISHTKKIVILQYLPSSNDRYV